MSEDMKFAVLFGLGLFGVGAAVLGTMLYVMYLILGKDGTGQR